MAAPEGTHPVTLTVASGDHRIDNLLSNYKWDGPVGTPATLTYSFPTATSAWAPNYAEPQNSFYAPFSAAEAEAVRQVLQRFADVANITFTELSETGSSVGDLRFAWTSGPIQGAWAYLPFANPQAGDLWINIDRPYPRSVLFDDAPLAHEVAHALGITHWYAGPFKLPPDRPEDSRYTVMTYGEAQSPLLYDILALQYLYGANRSTRPGDDVYSLEPTRLEPYNLSMAIWDVGGNDTISAANLVRGFWERVRGVKIDLREGHSSEFPKWYQDADGRDHLVATQPSGSAWTVAFGVVIENAIGSGGDDLIIGNPHPNTLRGNAGDDTIDGGDGIDSAVFAGVESGYTSARQGAGWTVTDRTSGRDGTDTLTNIERLVFSDTCVALDLNGNAGVTAKILGAVFGAGAVANKLYAGIGLKYLDSGNSYADLMKIALDVRLGSGFKTSDGVTLLYQNLLGATPSAAEVAFWEGIVTSNQFTMTTLAMMAADHELNTNNIGLAGLAATGLDYTPA